MTGCSYCLNAGSGSCRNGIVGIEEPISSAVMTARTLGSARAAVVLIERIVPCATELRRMTARNSPGRVTSSTYSPRPRRKRRSSTRSIGLPTYAFAGRICLTELMWLGRLPGRQRVRDTAQHFQKTPPRSRELTQDSDRAVDHCG